MGLVTQIIIIALAGLGAGVVTGLASASASTVVIPVLVAFKICDPFTAITISLMTDVMSSAFTARTYAKNGNVKLKDGMLIAIVAVPTSILATKLSSGLNSDVLGYLSMASIAYLAYSFYTKSVKLQKVANGELKPEQTKERFAEHKTLAVIAFGVLIGFISGLVGAGGGLMILMILTAVMGMDTKSAIGTSVFIMMFIALVSGVSHIMLLDESMLSTLLPGVDGVGGYGRLAIVIAISGISSIFGAVGAATFANKTEEYKLLKVVSIFFVALLVFMVVSKFM